MLKITVTGKDVAALKAELQNLINALSALPTHFDATPVGATSETEKKPRAKKAKPEAPVEAAAPTTPPVEAPKVQAPQAVAPEVKTQPAVETTKQDVANALQKVFDKGGVPATLDVFSRFGVKRSSELRPEQYADVLDECAKYLA